MNRKRPKTVAALSLVVASVTFSCMPAPASAEPQDVKIRLEQPMSYGFDPLEAARGGNRIVADGSDRVLINQAGQELARLRDGKLVGSSNTKDSASRARPRTENTVSGNCGSSYIELERVGSRGSLRYNIGTGFILNRNAYHWEWEFNVRAEKESGGVYNFEWDDSGSMSGKRLALAIEDSTERSFLGEVHVGRVQRGRVKTKPFGIYCDSGHPTDALYMPEP